MTRGLYIAASGLLNRSRVLNTIGNNITNSNTAGYKKDTVVQGTFGEYLTYQMGEGKVNELGGITSGVTENLIDTSYEQGSAQNTGRSMDLAIEGEGFFTLLSPDGQIKLTRNGQFSMNPEGFLTNSSGDLVLGQGGPLFIGQSDFAVTAKGEIMVEGESRSTLQITCPTDLALLIKEEGAKFTNTDPAQGTNVFTGNIRRGFLENSNVDMIDEMSGMMEFSRSFQSCGQLIKMMDKIMEASVNEIARV